MKLKVEKWTICVVKKHQLILSHNILRIYPKDINQENHMERLRDVSFNNSNVKYHIKILLITIYYVKANFVFDI